MKSRLACYYSVVRFCPYPETDEFVNVGVVLACPQTGYLDFKRARRRIARVNDFFPELNPRVFSEALLSLHETLLSAQNIRSAGQLLADFDARRRRDEFFALVRARETILYFSEARTVMSEDPAKTLDDLYASYVDRRFAHAVEYQEVQMVRRLEELLRTHHLMNNFIRNYPVGDDRYRIHFPFVRVQPGLQHAERAIKALNLDKEEPTDVFRHADSWLNAVRRLRDFRTAPENLLFVVHAPKPDKSAHLDAYVRVMDDFRREDIPVALDSEDSQVLTFARLVSR